MLYLEQLKPEVRPFYYMIWDLVILIVTWKWCELKGASQVALVVKKRPANAGDVRFVPWVGKIPQEEGMATHSSILCLENPKDRGACRATVYRVAKSWTRLKWLNTQAQWVQKELSELYLKWLICSKIGTNLAIVSKKNWILTFLIEIYNDLTPGIKTPFKGIMIVRELKLSWKITLCSPFQEELSRR